MILLDTDHLTVLTDQRHHSHVSLIQRLIDNADQIALPIIAVEEHLRGILAMIHRYKEVQRQLWPYIKFEQALLRLRAAPIIPMTVSVVEIVKNLQKQRIKAGTQDLKIAAIALSHNALLISANLRDFKKVPGLRVESWIT